MPIIKSTAKKINAGLAERTGYKLTKIKTNQRHEDPEIAAIVAKVKPWTMTGPASLAGLVETVRYIVRNRIPGDVVECGVWRGGSMQAAALALLNAGDTSRGLHLFDTYEGMTEPTEHDVRFDGQTAADRLARFDREDSNIWAYASLDDVQDGFSHVPYPAERIHFIKGPVEDTIPEQAPGQIAVLRLDTDWYESTAHELAHLYERLSPGGVLILDDYEWWQGARKATDEFMAGRGSELLLLPLGPGRIAVKPR